ncbi:glycosyltransferase family 2 protein [uncultured Roseivirga sp.]|uniref:glycosyltransferase n=1 Tax=uncultured Roseivirga sp. TaxID=543088 RepID=UPI000D7A36FE|nr:glycosyltransferase family 2 protein [uncultured Roseivirga sp.]PWL31613.1 MAG: hypothetical protein DCO95_00065 [Roseivirga sp. XM-24bin3]
MKTLFEILLAPVLIYLTVSALYQFVLAVASKYKTKDIQPVQNGLTRFLVLVPAYKEDAIIKYSTAKNMSLKYEYPRGQFDLVVIADQLKDETKKELKQLGAKVHSVSFEKSTKVKSLQSAIKAYDKGYDAVVVLDADNVMEKGFLFKANQWIQSGARAIQGLRKAANNNTSTALMDGLSEAANTEMLCKGANSLGLSSKLSGSAMVFNFELFKTTINQCEAIGGFDKEMELILTRKREFIDYTADMAVLDQKVTSTNAFTKQRGRWLEAQYTFFKKSFGESLSNLAEGNVDFFHKVMQLALPPRAVAPFAILLLVVCGILLNSSFLGVTATIAFVGLSLSYLFVLPTDQLFKQSLKILVSIPKIGWAAIKSLSQMKKSKQEFIHTKHELIEA